MSLRIAFDLDGVLADFETAYREVEERLFGAADAEQPVLEPEAQAAEESENDGDDPTLPQERAGTTDHPRFRPTPGRQSRVWREIEATENFWETLKPIDDSVVPRIQALASQHNWEIFFVTQRPGSAGDTVQRQTQRWLVRQGFETPSVLVLQRSRGRLADALSLDYLVDDSTKNCVDVISESHTKALLVLGHAHLDHPRPARAKSLGIGVVPSAAAGLDLLEEVQSIRGNPGLLEKLARMVGWSRA